MTAAGRRPDGGPRFVVVAIVLIGTIGATLIIAASGVPGPFSNPREHAPPTQSPDGLGDDVEQLHAQGVTGENVTVAVLDPTGFDTDHPTLTGRIASTRAFADGESIENGGRNEHGTAAAAVVARTAPAAELLLTSFDTTDGFVVAVDWLVRQGVDVIVMPVGFYGKHGDGESRVARAAASASRRGTVVVAPSGNLGQSHWRGRFSPEADGTHQFRGGSRNYLLGTEDRAALWLSWSETAADASFTLELFRTNGSASRLVARSQPFPGDDVSNARIDAAIDPAGTYYVVARGPDAANGTWIELASPTHDFQYQQRGHSVVAPATAELVLSVGAYDRGTDGVEPFSSAGPVGGRPGVDVVAPGTRNVTGQPARFEGSSAAAAYVGAVAALMLDAEPSLSPATVEAVMRATAKDVGVPGVDNRSGAGLVNARRAVAGGRNATQS